MAYSHDLADIDYHGLTWTVMDCHGLSWTVIDCHGSYRLYFTYCLVTDWRTDIRTLVIVKLLSRLKIAFSFGQWFLDQMKLCEVDKNKLCSNVVLSFQDTTAYLAMHCNGGFTVLNVMRFYTHISLLTKSWLFWIP